MIKQTWQPHQTMGVPLGWHTVRGTWWSQTTDRLIINCMFWQSGTYYVSWGWNSCVKISLRIWRTAYSKGWELVTDWWEAHCGQMFWQNGRNCVGSRCASSLWGGTSWSETSDRLITDRAMLWTRLVFWTQSPCMSWPVKQHRGKGWDMYLLYVWVHGAWSSKENGSLL